MYEISNGVELVGGNVQIHPLRGGNLSFESASTFLRDAQWPIPAQLQIFGGDGSDDLFGIWTHGLREDRAPVICVGAIFKPDCMAIAADSLTSFLLHRTAYYLLALEAPAEALDAINLPPELRKLELDDESWDAIGAWAQPGRRGSTDPHKDRLGPEEVAMEVRHAV